MNNREIKFPENLEGYAIGRALGGGTASVFSISNAATAQTLVLKCGAHEDAAKIEILCNIVYRALGVRVPQMRVYHSLPPQLATELQLQSPSGVFQVSEYLQQQSALSDHVVRATARQNFVAHALLGNIDVAKADNFIVSHDQDAYLIDAGANFLFRAKGSHRREHPALVSEIDSLRNALINPEGSIWFGDLTHAEIAVQVAGIAAKHREIESAVWVASTQLDLPDELRDKFLEFLSDRLDHLTMRFGKSAQQHAKTDKKAQADQTAAGVLSYTMINDEPHLLLSRRVGHEWWDNFGGKSNQQDVYLSDTARREVAEESSGQLNYSNLELNSSPFHDIVTGTGNKQFIYRMYISPADDVDLTVLQDHEHTLHQWVPLTAVLEALNGSERVTQEGKETVIVRAGQYNLPIFPPLFQMLRQPAVYANLQKLFHGQRVQVTHTLGYEHLHGDGKDISSYRPLVTPVKKRQQIAATLKYKSSLARQLKKLRNYTHSIVNQPAIGLSQSEIYLRAVLGDHYQQNDLAANVRCFVNKYYGHHEYLQDINQKELLIQRCVALIAREKTGGADKVYYYHACNNEIAFAYDVYTSLYQALHADDQWTAFRPDSEHFKRFAGIEEFVAFYSANHSNTINNNDAHFNDCALSTNVFLFGNHETPTSSSIHYFIENDIRRAVNLEELFGNILHPFHASSEEIRRLIKLFNDCGRDQGGTLYQIAVPLDQACAMSYPAGCVGVMNPWRGSRNLPDILQALTVADLQDEQTQKYVRRLQARLMVPPHLQLGVVSVKWRALPDDQQRAYHHELKKCVDSILDLILRHHTALHDYHRKTAMIRMLPSVLAENQLSLTAHMSDSMLVRAILANDAAQVKKIFTNYPEYKFREMTIPRAYIATEAADFQPAEKVSTLTMLLLYSSIPLAVIQDCYGDILMAASHVKLVDTKKLKYRLKSMPESLRYQFIKACDPDVTKIDMVKILDWIAPSDQFAFCMQYIDNLLLSHSVIIDLADILGVLDINSRLEFARVHYDKIATSSDFGKVLRALPSYCRLEFAMHHEQLILSGEDLGHYLSALEPEDRVGFTMRHQDKIHSGQDIEYIIDRLDDTEKIAFLKNYQDKITEGSHVYGILWSLPVEVRLEFATHLQTMILPGNHLHHIVSLLAMDDRIAFVEHNADKIGDGQEFAAILALLRPADRCEFVVRHQVLITSIDDITLIAAELSGEAQSSLVMQSKDLICSWHDFSKIMKYIPSDTLLNFAVELSEQLAFTNGFAGVVHQLPQAERLNFVASYPHYINDQSKLAVILAALNLDDRYDFAEKHQNNLTNGNSLAVILRLLPKSQQLDFAISHHHVIQKNTAEIFMVLKAFVDIQDRVRFALAYPEFIDDTKKIARMIEEYLTEEFGNNEFALEFAEGWMRIETGVDAGYLALELLKILPSSCRSIFAGAHASDLLKNYSLPQILLCLPESDSGAFALTYQYAIDDIEILTRVLLILPIEARMELAVLHLDKIIKTWQQVMVRQLLAPEVQTEFEDNWYERRQANHLASYGIFAPAKIEATATFTDKPTTAIKPE